jgi:hypothetical protein
MIGKSLQKKREATQRKPTKEARIVGYIPIV